MPENVIICYRGANYAIGQGQHFYGIWPASVPEGQPLEWWPHTPEGWSAAWSRFAAIEVPGTIGPVSGPVPEPQPALVADPATGPVAGPATGPVAGALTGALTGQAVSSRSPRGVAAAVLLGVGVALGLAGLFPSYTDGSSLAQEAFNLVPHVIYLAAWGTCAGLILLGGARQRVGALLGVGTSAVTFGLFFADAGTPLAGGAHLMGAGLVLSILGWFACTVGAVLAARLGPVGRPAVRRLGHEIVPTATLMLAALGAAIAFAPSWDSFTLRTAAGATQTVTAGNAFANPGPVIAGDVLVMVALVAVVLVAALWRPTRLGAALVVGAIIPMVAQAISAVVQVFTPASPLDFGISPSQAAAAGLTIDAGLTPMFWVYCAFLVTVILLSAWMLVSQDSAAAGTRPWQPVHAPLSPQEQPH